MKHIEMVSARHLDEWIQQRKPALVDIRSAKAYSCGHIKGAVNIPYEELGRHIAEIPQNAVIYCERGTISMLAVRMLAEQGVEAISLAGGYCAYQGKYLERGERSK